MSYELQIGPPFDLELTLECGQGHRWRPDPNDPGWYIGVLDSAPVRIRQKEKDGPLEFEAGTDEVESWIFWQFRADDDIEAVYEKLACDRKMATLVKGYRGLRIMRIDPWESLVFFILSAHNHYQLRVATAATADSMDKIARAFWEGETYPNDRYPFPSAGQIISHIGLAKLEELWSDEAENPRRIRGLIDMPLRIYEAARFVEAGQLEVLRGQSTEHIVQVLRIMIRGVGPKTARCVALFGLGRLDAFPESTQVTDALLSLYGRDPFQPIAGYASQFLFMEGLKNPSRRKTAQRREIR